MKNVLKLSLICSVLLCVASAARPQTEDRLTAEKEEVIKLAKKFSERYEQTKSLEPLIGEFFVPSFDRNLQNFRFWSDSELTEIDTSKIDKRVLRRFYVSYWDTFHLSGIWIWQTGSKERRDDYLPADVKRLMVQNRFLGQAFLYPDEDDNELEPISTIEEFTRTAIILEAITRLYRRHLHSFPLNKSTDYAKNYLEFERDMEDYFDPWGAACDAERDCFGLPNRSMIYNVAVPPYLVLTVGKVNNETKILEISWYTN